MKRVSIGCLLVLAALCLALAIQAQQTLTPQPAQPMAASQPDYLFTNAIADKAVIGPHIVHGGVNYIGPVVLADSGEVIFEADFHDNGVIGKVGPVKGLYTSSGTSGRVVIEEGANIGGTLVLEIINTQPGQLQTNRLGQVAWLATIQGAGCASATCTALFVEKQLIAISTAGTASYLLTDDGQIQAPANAAWFLPAGGGQATAGDKGPRGSAGKSVWDTVRTNIRVPGIGINVPWSRIPITIGAPSGNPLPTGTPAAPGQPVQAPQPAPGPRPVKFPATPTPVTCPLPVGDGLAFPFLWSETGSAAGPIGSFRSEPPFNGALYRSALHPKVPIWTRKNFFAFDCRVVMTVLGVPGLGAEELFTPAGLFGYFDSGEGSYKFNGVPAVVLPPASKPIEDGIRINRRCRILIPITVKRPFGEELNLILGAPTQPGHCPE